MVIGSSKRQESQGLSRVRRGVVFASSVARPEGEEACARLQVDGEGGFPLLMSPCVTLSCIIIMRIIGSALTGPIAARMPG